MGKWVHRLHDVNVDEMTAVCAHCGLVRVVMKDGRPKCKVARDALRGPRPKPSLESRRKRQRHKYNGYRKDMVCSRCGFEAEVLRQMDVHHIDGDHHNNSHDNLTTLCANCHRLVHALERTKAPG